MILSKKARKVGLAGKVGKEVRGEKKEVE